VYRAHRIDDAGTHMWIVDSTMHGDEWKRNVIVAVDAVKE